MNEWSTYTLSDLLMFSARTYFRLIELYNLAIWPLHLLAAAAGVVLVWCAQRGDERSGRVAAGLIGLCWLWVAWAFHAERYATINSAAVYFAPGFAIQGLLLIFVGSLRANRDRFGFGLLLLALLGYPLLALLAGRQWQQAEMFGIAPDPTVAVTLAMLALSPRANWALLAGSSSVERHQRSDLVDHAGAIRLGPADAGAACLVAAPAPGQALAYSTNTTAVRGGMLNVPLALS